MHDIMHDIMRHICLIALALFMCALPAQAAGWDIPTYDKDDFCNEGINDPELLEEFVHEALEHFKDEPEEKWRAVSLCARLEKKAHSALLSLRHSIAADISAGEIKDCEKLSQEETRHGSYYKLAFCLLDIGEHLRVAGARRHIFSELPIYNSFKFCEERVEKSDHPDEKTRLSQGYKRDRCVDSEKSALRSLSRVRFKESSISLDMVKACDKEISAAKGSGSYKKLYGCTLEMVRAGHRRGIRERIHR